MAIVFLEKMDFLMKDKASTPTKLVERKNFFVAPNIQLNKFSLFVRGSLLVFMTVSVILAPTAIMLMMKISNANKEGDKKKISLSKQQNERKNLGQQSPTLQRKPMKKTSNDIWSTVPDRRIPSHDYNQLMKVIVAEVRVTGNNINFQQRKDILDAIFNKAELELAKLFNRDISISDEQKKAITDKIKVLQDKKNENFNEKEKKELINLIISKRKENVFKEHLWDKMCNPLGELIQFIALNPNVDEKNWRDYKIFKDVETNADKFLSDMAKEMDKIEEMHEELASYDVALQAMSKFQQTKHDSSMKNIVDDVKIIEQYINFLQNAYFYYPTEMPDKCASCDIDLWQRNFKKVIQVEQGDNVIDYTISELQSELLEKYDSLCEKITQFQSDEKEKNKVFDDLIATLVCPLSEMIDTFDLDLVENTRLEEQFYGAEKFPLIRGERTLNEEEKNVDERIAEIRKKQKENLKLWEELRENNPNAHVDEQKDNKYVLAYEKIVRQNEKLHSQLLPLLERKNELMKANPAVFTEEKKLLIKAKWKKERCEKDVTYVKNQLVKCVNNKLHDEAKQWRDRSQDLQNIMVALNLEYETALQANMPKQISLDEFLENVKYLTQAEQIKKLFAANDENLFSKEDQEKIHKIATQKLNVQKAELNIDNVNAGLSDVEALKKALADSADNKTKTTVYGSNSKSWSVQYPVVPPVR